MALLSLWFVYVFLVGIAVGSFLNVCIARLPYEKSLIWPGSRCGSCFQPIRLRDNIPLISWLLLGGKCRTCQSVIPIRYFLVELLTGLLFVGLFYLEMVHNLLGLPLIRARWGLAPGLVPPEGLVLFGHHAVLLCFLLVASVCDLMEMEIPLSLTLTGTFVGLVFSALLPWPYPEPLPLLLKPRPDPFPPVPGVYAWPLWYPLPGWLPAGSWQAGLATGVAGALAGMILLRGVRFLFTVGRGIEGLGVGDADLMMMAGAFIGWQPVIIAFFVSVGPGLFFALALLAIKGEQMLPFGPSLALGVMITVLTWPILGAHFAPLFFDGVFLALLGIAGAVALLMISFLLRVVR